MFFLDGKKLDIFYKPLVSPKKYFQTEFEAHTLQFRSTHEYFKTAKYELQTPTTTMFLMDILVNNSQFKMSKISQYFPLKEKHAYMLPMR